MKLSMEEAVRLYGMGTVSKLGLILKEKEDGTMKRRIIIDLRRSGGNSKSALPERLTLPRPVDAVRMATFQCEEEAALKGKYYKFGWDQNWHTAWLLGAFVEKAKAETKAGGPEAGKPGKTTRCTSSSPSSSASGQHLFFGAGSPRSLRGFCRPASKRPRGATRYIWTIACGLCLAEEGAATRSLPSSSLRWRPSASRSPTRRV